MTLRAELRELVSDFRMLAKDMPTLRMSWITLKDMEPILAITTPNSSPIEHGMPHEPVRVVLLMKRAGKLLDRIEIPEKWRWALAHPSPASRWERFVLASCGHLSGVSEVELPPERIFPTRATKGKPSRDKWQPPPPVPEGVARGTFYCAAEIMALAAETLLEMPVRGSAADEIDGVLSGLTKQQKKMIRALWDKKDRRVRRSFFVKEVWGNKRVEPDSEAAAIRRLNNERLMEKEFEIKYDADYVELVGLR